MVNAQGSAWYLPKLASGESAVGLAPPPDPHAVSSIVAKGGLESGRIPSLDGARALAIVGVLLAHVCATSGFPASRALRRYLTQGAIGVEVFFVISGFLITVLMLREIARFNRLALLSFYRRRVLRIVPAYVTLLLVVALLTVAGVATVKWPDWIAALTYTVNFLHRPAWEVGHAWSLSIEEHFYVLWPLVILGGEKFATRMCLAMLGVCVAARWVVLLEFPGCSQMAELCTFTRLDSIAIGCLLALFAWDDGWRTRLDLFTSRSTVQLLAAAALVVSVAMSMRSAKWAVGVAYTINAIAIAVLLWSMVRRPASRFGKALNHRWVATVGVGSYSLYLWQQLFLNPSRANWICRWPQNLVLACAAATASYWIVERPFLRLKDSSRHVGTVRPPARARPMRAERASQNQAVTS